MCICATDIKMCTYAGRVRASLALDARERTRRPCYNAFTSFSQRTPLRNHLMYVNWTKLSMDMSANSACYVQDKSQTISPHLTRSSTFLPGTCCKLLTAKPLQRSTQYLPPREIDDHYLWHCEIENNQFASLKNGILSSKHTHLYSRRTICSPDAEEYAPALHSVQLTSLVDPELKSFMSSSHWHTFGAGHR